MAVHYSSNRPVGKETRGEGTERKKNPLNGSLAIKDLCQTLLKAFDMSRPTVRVSPKSLKEDDQDSVRKARRLPVDRPLRKPYWQSERKL